MEGCCSFIHSWKLGWHHSASQKHIVKFTLQAKYLLPLGFLDPFLVIFIPSCTVQFVHYVRESLAKQVNAGHATAINRQREGSFYYFSGEGLHCICL
jgi:hypothetical protein